MNLRSSVFAALCLLSIPMGFLSIPTAGAEAQGSATGVEAQEPLPASPSSPLVDGPVVAPEAARPAGPDLVLVDDQAGRVWNIFGLEIVGKIFSHDTDGRYSVIVSHVPPGGGPPRHVHEHEDELFYVLHGEFEFFSGESTVQATAGALVSLPRGLPHGFRNVGEEKGVLINTIVPGGFEDFFEAIDQLPKDQPLDREKVEAIAAGFGLRFVGP